MRIYIVNKYDKYFLSKTDFVEGKWAYFVPTHSLFDEVPYKCHWLIMTEKAIFQMFQNKFGIFEIMFREDKEIYISISDQP